MTPNPTTTELTMTHAHALIETDPGTAQPDSPPPAEPRPPLDRSPSPARPITEVIAGALSGLHTAWGDLIHLMSVVTDDGTIVLDVERLSVSGRCFTMRTVLTMSEPRLVEPGSAAQADPEIETSAT